MPRTSRCKSGMAQAAESRECVRCHLFNGDPTESDTQVDGTYRGSVGCSRKFFADEVLDVSFTWELGDHGPHLAPGVDRVRPRTRQDQNNVAFPIVGVNTGGDVIN